MKNLRNVLFLFTFLLFSGFSLAEPVNINTADATTLAASIKGVGTKKAVAIIAYREEYGPFKSVTDLAQVRGIGLRTIEKNLQNLSVGEDDLK